MEKSISDKFNSGESREGPRFHYQSAGWNLHRRASLNERAWTETTQQWTAGFSGLRRWKKSPHQKERLAADLVFHQARDLTC